MDVKALESHVLGLTREGLRAHVVATGILYGRGESHLHALMKVCVCSVCVFVCVCAVFVCAVFVCVCVCSVCVCAVCVWLVCVCVYQCVWTW